MRSSLVRIAALSLSASAVVVATLAPMLTAAEPAKNLIENGDLESALPAGAAMPKDWTLFAKGEYKAAVVEGGHAGKKAIMLEGDGEFAVIGTGMRAIDPKQRVTIRGMLKVEGDAKATIKFDYFDEKWQWVGSTTVGELGSDTKGWQAVSLMDRAAIDGEKAKHYAVGLAITGKGKAWFDDLELTAGAAAATATAIENGDFENYLGKTPAQWWIGTSEGGKATATISTDAPKQGKSCLHFKGDAEWAVATSAKVKFDANKTYIISGFVRTKSGAAQIKIDYFNGNEWIGSTLGEDVYDDEWTAKSVESTNDYSEATHIAATCVGSGDFDAKFDAITIRVK